MLAHQYAMLTRTHTYGMCLLFVYLGCFGLSCAPLHHEMGPIKPPPVNRHVISALRDVFFGRLLVYMYGWVLFRTSTSCPHALTGHSPDLLESLLFTSGVPWDGPGVQ